MDLVPQALLTIYIQMFVTNYKMAFAFCPGSDMITKLLKMQMLDEDDELAYSTQSSTEEEEKKVDGRPAWMRTLHNSLATWLQLVPKVTTIYHSYNVFFSKIKVQIVCLDSRKPAKEIS